MKVQRSSKLLTALIALSFCLLHADNDVNKNEPQSITVTITNDTEIPFRLLNSKILKPGETTSYSVHPDTWENVPFVVSHEANGTTVFTITANKLFYKTPKMRIHQIGKNRYILETFVEKPGWQKVPSARKAFR